MDLGEKIKELREKNDMTLEELGDRVGADDTVTDNLLAWICVVVDVHGRSPYAISVRRKKIFQNAVNMWKIRGFSDKKKKGCRSTP